MNVGATSVGVTYAGPSSFIQTTCGINYWAPNVYTSAAVPNAPPPCDIVALGTGGTKSITFSQAVTNPYIAFLSWNGQDGVPVAFTGLNGATPVTPTLELLSSGTSYWGPGTATVAANSLVIFGEVGGTIQLDGTFTEIDFSDRDETWHGFTVGAASLGGSVAAAPEPATFALLGTGLLFVGGMTSRRRKASKINSQQ
jgi:hypothetical protein